MKKMYIYEGAMCCSTGVCGVSPDEELMRVSSLVDKINKSGAKIERGKYPSNEEFYEMLFLADEAKEETNTDSGSCCSGSGCC